MGPSAPYLAGLIETLIKQKKNIPGAISKLNTSPELKPKSNIIPLLPLISQLVQKNYNAEQIITLLFDLKRTGDYEQANAAKKLLEMDPDTSIILGTGDIFMFILCKINWTTLRIRWYWRLSRGINTFQISN